MSRFLSPQLPPPISSFQPPIPPTISISVAAGSAASPIVSADASCSSSELEEDFGRLLTVYVSYLPFQMTFSIAKINQIGKKVSW
jgi:hypothetical protein